MAWFCLTPHNNLGAPQGTGSAWTTPGPQCRDRKCRDHPGASEQGHRNCREHPGTSEQGHRNCRGTSGTSVQGHKKKCRDHPRTSVQGHRNCRGNPGVLLQGSGKQPFVSSAALDGTRCPGVPTSHRGSQLVLPASLCCGKVHSACNARRSKGFHGANRFRSQTAVRTGTKQCVSFQ